MTLYLFILDLFLFSEQDLKRCSTSFHILARLFNFDFNCTVHCVLVSIKVKGEGEERFVYVLFGGVSVSTECQFSLGSQGRQVNCLF